MSSVTVRVSRPTLGLEVLFSSFEYLVLRPSAEGLRKTGLFSDNLILVTGDEVNLSSASILMFGLYTIAEIETMFFVLAVVNWNELAYRYSYPSSFRLPRPRFISSP